jgi:hypothetical protein
VLAAARPGFRTSADGQVIDGQNITGSVYVDHKNVIIRNCKIKGDGGSTWAIDIGRNGPASATITDCTIDSNRSDQGGIRNQSNGSAWTALRCNIFNGENGVRLGGNAVIQDSWIHSFASSSSAPHYDCVEVYEGSNSQVIHNYLDLNQNETSCVNVQGDFGSISGTIINNNWFGGGGWTLNIRGTDTGAHPVTNTAINKNTFGRMGGFGYVVNTSTGTTGSGNVDSAGKTVSIA